MTLATRIDMSSPLLVITLRALQDGWQCSRKARADAPLFMTRRKSVAALAIILGACAAPHPQPTIAEHDATKHGGMMQGGMMHGGMPDSTSAEPSSPLAVAGTSMSEVDVPEGAALDFVTIGDVAEVQRRVALAAESHNQRASDAGCMGPGEGTSMGMMGEGRPMETAGAPGVMGSNMMTGAAGTPSMMHGPGMSGMMATDMMPRSRARMEPLPNGARLVFIAADTKDVDALRRHARMQVVHSQMGNCPMVATTAPSLPAPAAKRP
jgi:hypothetical protein